MIIEVLTESLMISAFVFVMLLAIEYINMCTRGAAQHAVSGGPWRQYLLAAGLGATPGCLGAFAGVSLYVHGLLSLGALVGCMIATSGDEAFVLLAVNPRMGLFLMGLLFLIGLGAAWLTDCLHMNAQWEGKQACRELVVHEEAACGPFSWRRTVGYWKPCSAHRGVLTTGLLIFVGAIALGEIGPQEWNWIRVTLLLVTFFTVFVVATVPDHFLEEHLWKHVAVMHVPRIFVWTFGALLVTHFASNHVGVEQWIHQNPATLLVLACLLGIIPESGPHLLFVTLFAEGSIPFSILLASSIVQDGHGMLPLLGESFKTFAIVKAINLAVGFSGWVGRFRVRVVSWVFNSTPDPVTCIWCDICSEFSCPRHSKSLKWRPGATPRQYSGPLDERKERSSDRISSDCHWWNRWRPDRLRLESPAGVQRILTAEPVMTP